MSGSFQRWWTNERIAGLLRMRYERKPWPVIADALATTEAAAIRKYYNILQLYRRRRKAVRIQMENENRMLAARRPIVKPERIMTSKRPVKSRGPDPSDELLRRLKEAHR